MGSLSGYEILLIEDSAEMVVQVRKVLEHDGASLSDARTARSGLASAVEIHPHLILCDLSLLGGGGFHFLSEVRKVRSLDRVPILVLGAANDRQGFMRAMRLGASDCLVKPVQASLLAQKVERLLTGSVFGAHGFAEHDRPECALTTPMEIVRADEGGLAIEAPVALGPEADVRIDSPLLQQMGLAGAITRSADGELTQPSDKGGYLNDINFVGVDPKATKAIRSFVRGGRPGEGAQT